jgi:hypothetical protein
MLIFVDFSSIVPEQSAVLRMGSTSVDGLAGNFFFDQPLREFRDGPVSFCSLIAVEAGSG